MPRLIVHSFTISLDGYGAGPNQSKETPLGAAIFFAGENIGPLSWRMGG